MCVVTAASTDTTTKYCGKTNNRKPFWRKTKKNGKEKNNKQNKAVIVPNLNRAKEKTHEMIYFFSCVAARR